MAIIKNVELRWLYADPERPQQYKGQGRRRWKVQIATFDKAEAALWKKEYGLAATPEEDEASGKIKYVASLTRPAYKAKEGSDGQLDDLDSKNTPVNVLDASGTPIDPNTVGNGSVGDVAVQVFVRPTDKEIFRTLKTIVVRTWRKRKAFVDEDQFDFSGETKVIEEDGNESKAKESAPKTSKAKSGRSAEVVEDDISDLF